MMVEGFSLDLTGQGVGLQDAGALGGWRWQLEVVQVVGAVLQSAAEVRQRQQQSQEVGSRHAIEGFGAGAEVQSGLKKAAHPLLILRRRDALSTVASTGAENLQVYMLHHWDKRFWTLGHCAVFTGVLKIFQKKQ